jgi:hypothetical protein
MKRKKKCKKGKKRTAKDLIGPGLSLVSAGLLISAAMNKDAAAWKRIAEGVLAAGALNSARKQLFKDKEEE